MTPVSKVKNFDEEYPPIEIVLQGNKFTVPEITADRMEQIQDRFRNDIAEARKAQKAVEEAEDTETAEAVSEVNLRIVVEQLAFILDVPYEKVKNVPIRKASAALKYIMSELSGDVGEGVRGKD